MEVKTTVPASIGNKLAAIARQRGISVSDLIAHIVVEGLEKSGPEKATKKPVKKNVVPLI